MQRLRPPKSPRAPRAASRGGPDAATAQHEQIVRLLQESEERFRELVEHVEDVLYVLEGEPAAITYVSPACEVLFGCLATALEATPYPHRQFLDPLDRQRLDAAHAALQPGAGFAEEYPIRRANGDVRWVRHRAYRVDSSDAWRVVGVVRDVTADRQLSEELRQGQKLQSVGVLASTVAHDFNNVLMSIAGSAEQALEVLDPAAPARPYLRDILEATSHGGNIASQLLSFGRQRPADPRPVPLDLLVQRMAGLLRSLVGGRIELRLEAQAGHAVVMADRAELEQVLLNLAANARDAMPQGGVLTLRTGRDDLGAADAERLGLPAAGRCLRLEVSDTGVGMDEATRRRIFEPFFTTKGAARGNGIGLTTVFSIVGKLGGHIDVDSTPGRGTSVTLLLPSAGEWVPEASAEPPELIGAGRVLLVEDERLVRRTICHYLGRLGYEVVEAGGAEEALQRSHDVPGLEMLITDVGLPDGHGPTLAEAIDRRHPGLSVLFVSAYPQGSLRRDGSLPPSAQFLQKPFDQRALGAKLRELKRRS